MNTMNVIRRRLIPGLLIAVAGCGRIALAAPNETPDNEEARAATALLVRQLGDEEFAVRETAAEKLTKLGLAARPELEEGAKDSDREVRYRCERILAQVRQFDLALRIEAFSNDRDSENDHGLPGWRRFRKLAGDSVATRSLFVEMLKADAESLEAVEKDPKGAGESVQARLQQLQQLAQFQSSQLPLGNIAVLLFLAVDDDVSLSPQSVNLMSNLFQQQSFHNVMQGGPRRDLLAKLLGTWIKRTDDFNLYQGMYLAMLHNIPEGLSLAERVLKGQHKNNLLNQAYIRQQAIFAVAKFGGEPQIPLLEPLLEDKAVVFPKQQNIFHEAQMRDVALAGLVYLTKQNLKDYGFDKAELNPTTLFSIHLLGFETEEKRAAALKRWQDFRGKGK